MDITNEAQAEKHRLQAMGTLIESFKEPIQGDIFRLLQPWGASDSYSSAETTLAVAKNSQLVSVDDGEIMKGMLASRDLESPQNFQSYLIHELLGVLDENQSHYLFNLFSAWYAVQDERVLYELAGEYDVPFDAQVFPDAPSRQFNSYKFATWRKWAFYLGLGRPVQLGGRKILVPDATLRLQPMLAEVFAEQQALTCARFMERLARLCPELDGGLLYNYCWQASRGSEEKGNRLSLMLSTALRTLDGLGEIHLQAHADVLESWQLYPAEGHKHKRVTHIEYGGGK